MAMALLAVAGVTSSWQEAKGLHEKRFLKTREIIDFINKNFEESISSGSYDDIRRKDLKLLVVANFILNSANNPNAATNDPTRGYTLAPDFTELIRTFQTPTWQSCLQFFLKNTITLREQLARQRSVTKIPVLLPDGHKLELTPGVHNELQKQIVEEFLPRYGQNAQILYIGDTANKQLFKNEEKLQALNFFELSHDELPDIIAYQSAKNWLYLIEAVHSSGSISEVRMLELKELTQSCTASIIYVTAFMTKRDFRLWADKIAWETEVWIAENPDHLIHFNSDKFLGPHYQ